MATFLDLDIKAKENSFQIKTYDKRDAFNFEIVTYPDLSGNIPTQPAYGVFTVQVIRYAKTCNQPEDIVDRLLIKKLIKKNYTTDGLRRALRKCLRTNQWIIQKIGYQSRLLDGQLFGQ